MYGMDAEQSRLLIEKAGGNHRFAELLKITDRPFYLQRVNNWKRRGIPAAILLRHQSTIRSLQRKAG